MAAARTSVTDTLRDAGALRVSSHARIPNLFVAGTLLGAASLVLVVVAAGCRRALRSGRGHHRAHQPDHAESAGDNIDSHVAASAEGPSRGAPRSRNGTQIRAASALLSELQRRQQKCALRPPVAVPLGPSARATKLGYRRPSENELEDSTLLELDLAAEASPRGLDRGHERACASEIGAEAAVGEVRGARASMQYARRGQGGMKWSKLSSQMD
jgi:hypothetical protein